MPDATYEYQKKYPCDPSTRKEILADIIEWTTDISPTTRCFLSSSLSLARLPVLLIIRFLVSTLLFVPFRSLVPLTEFAFAFSVNVVNVMLMSLVL